MERPSESEFAAFMRELELIESDLDLVVPFGSAAKTISLAERIRSVHEANVDKARKRKYDRLRDKYNEVLNRNTLLTRENFAMKKQLAGLDLEPVLVMEAIERLIERFQQQRLTNAFKVEVSLPPETNSQVTFLSEGDD